MDFWTAIVSNRPRSEVERLETLVFSERVEKLEAE